MEYFSSSCFSLILVYYLIVLLPAKYEAADEPEILTSPNYPRPYKRNQESFVERLKATSLSKRIRLSFLNLTLPSGKDFLYIYDGHYCTSLRSKLIKKYTGRLTGEEIVYSTSDELCVELYRDYGGGLYKLTWTEFPSCGGIINHPSGDILSPGYPRESYPKQMDCQWNISVNEGQRIRYTIQDLDLHSSKDCTNDRVELHSLLPPARSTQFFCGKLDNAKRVYVSSSFNSLVRFKTSDPWLSNTARGFWIQYEATGCTSPDMLIENNGGHLVEDSNKTYYDNGNVVRYVCPPLQIYTSGVKERYTTCQKNNDWETFNDTCKDITCTAPFVPHEVQQDPIHENNVYPISTLLTFTCKKEMILAGPSAITCLPSGNWNESAPVCYAAKEANCPRPEAPDHGFLTSVDVKVAGEVVYKCDTGYKMDGQDTITCQRDETWDTEPPTCKVIECIQLVVSAGSHLNIDQSDKVSHIGSRVYYHCDPGFVITSGESMRSCQENAEWSGTGEPTCSEIRCPAPLAPSNGHHRLDIKDSGELDPDIVDLAIGSRVRYGCVTSFILYGPEMLVCQNDGTWSAAPPACRELLCPAIMNISNAVKDIPASQYMDMRDIKCQNNWFMDEQRTMNLQRLICLQTGNWSEWALPCSYEGAIPPSHGQNTTTINPTDSTNSHSVSPEVNVTTTDQSHSFTSSSDTTSNGNNTTETGGNVDIGGNTGRNTGGDGGNVARDAGICVGVIIILILILLIFMYIWLQKRRARPAEIKYDGEFENPTYNVDSGKVSVVATPSEADVQPWSSNEIYMNSQNVIDSDEPENIYDIPPRIK